MQINLNVKCIGTYSHPSAAVDRSNSASDNGPPVHGEGVTTAPRPSEELATVTASLPWHTRALTYLTRYSELCAACLPEDFVRVRTRLQQEWIFNGGFVSQFTIVFFDS